jgi:formate--tetrahydrofolate ligase
VATIRALKMQGGVAKTALGAENVAAVKAGMVNLERHAENMGKFGLPVVVALNHFTSDTEAEIEAVRMAARGIEVHLCTHWRDGATGATGLARAVVKLIEGRTARYRPLYPESLGLADKLRTIAREIYRADDIELSPSAARRIAAYEKAGFGHVPVCVAKTPYSFSADPTLLGAPTGHTLPVREVRLSAGAGFMVAITGTIMTMPGLPRTPSAEGMHLSAEGLIEGLS